MRISDVPKVLQALNGFHKNLNFTVDIPIITALCQET